MEGAVRGRLPAAKSRNRGRHRRRNEIIKICRAVQPSCRSFVGLTSCLQRHKFLPVQVNENMDAKVRRILADTHLQRSTRPTRRRGAADMKQAIPLRGLRKPSSVHRQQSADQPAKVETWSPAMIRKPAAERARRDADLQQAPHPRSGEEGACQSAISNAENNPFVRPAWTSRGTPSEPLPCAHLRAYADARAGPTRAGNGCSRHWRCAFQRLLQPDPRCGAC